VGCVGSRILITGDGMERKGSEMDLMRLRRRCGYVVALARYGREATFAKSG
jgi:hypothetical protein